MNVSVFCSSNDLADTYTGPARQLAAGLAKAGCSLFYGASGYGLMRIMADGFRSKGAAITGVALESETPNVDGELIIVADVKTRKRLLLERAEVIIALAGGLGTLDELTEIIELKKEGLHCKPIIILNTAGFYDGLLAQLQRMDAEGFLPVVEKEGIKVQTLDQLVRIVQTPEEVVAFVGELEKADSTHD